MFAGLNSFRTKLLGLGLQGWQLNIRTTFKRLNPASFLLKPNWKTIMFSPYFTDRRNSWWEISTYSPRFKSLTQMTEEHFRCKLSCFQVACLVAIVEHVQFCSVVWRSTRLSPRGVTATMTMLWRNSWSITRQTHLREQFQSQLARPYQILAHFACFKFFQGILETRWACWRFSQTIFRTIRSVQQWLKTHAVIWRENPKSFPLLLPSSLRLTYTFGGASRPSNVARPVKRHTPKPLYQ